MRAAFLLLAGALCALASPASAHAFLDRAAPGVGTCGPAPTEIALTFSERVEPTLSRVAVSNAQGAPVRLEPAHVDDPKRRTLRARFAEPPAAGAYHVVWRVVSADSHVTQGAFDFTVAP